MSSPGKDFFDWIARETEPGPSTTLEAPSRLKSRIYSTLVRVQQESGELLSVSESKASGRSLCVFESLVEKAPVGETLKRKNFCQICHARVLAERMEKAPIFWAGCPYVDFQQS